MTRRLRVVTVDVFTRRRFGGNPLAVLPDAQGLSDHEMSALAREFNLSETAFVLPPEDPAHDARVRIFARGGQEMPFAGHPNVGTGFVLRDRARDGMLRFGQQAGPVSLRVAPDGVVTVAAPRPLSTGPALDPALLAPCAGLDARDVVLVAHAPVLASCGNPFILAEVTGEALTRAAPDPAAFREAARRVDGGAPGRLSLYLWARSGPGALRARMFAPLSGTTEDAATGSAAAPLAALLHSLGLGRAWTVTQGVEMGRPSTIEASAAPGEGGIRAAVGGPCVPVLEGWVTL